MRAGVRSAEQGPTTDATGRIAAASSLGVWATLRAGVRVSPELVDGIAWTLVLAVVAAAGRVVVPVAVQQAIDTGFGGAGGAQWTSNFLITVTFPILLAGIGLAATYGIYLVAAVISVFFVLRYVHETKGKELEQMEG